MKTRNGKIARLPREVRERLNRRLEDGEPGNHLVAWLNALPEARAVLEAEFGGRPVNGQNLSEWKQGGFREWQTRQERRELVCQWGEEAQELSAAAGGAAISDQLCAVLLVELTQAARELRDATTDPEARWQCLQALAGRLAQMRREETNAGRARIAQERWDREKRAEAGHQRAVGCLMPRHALLLQELYLSEFGSRGGNAARPETVPGQLLFTDGAPVPADPAPPDQGESN